MLKRLEDVWPDVAQLCTWLEAMERQSHLPEKDRDQVVRLVEQSIVRIVFGAMKREGG
jgi:hypothetical protein